MTLKNTFLAYALTTMGISFASYASHDYSRDDLTGYVLAISGAQEVNFNLNVNRQFFNRSLNWKYFQDDITQATPANPYNYYGQEKISFKSLSVWANTFTYNNNVKFDNGPQTDAPDRDNKVDDKATGIIFGASSPLVNIAKDQYVRFSVYGSWGDAKSQYLDDEYEINQDVWGIGAGFEFHNNQFFTLITANIHNFDTDQERNEEEYEPQYDRLGNIIEATADPSWVNGHSENTRSFSIAALFGYDLSLSTNTILTPNIACHYIYVQGEKGRFANENDYVKRTKTNAFIFEPGVRLTHKFSNKCLGFISASYVLTKQNDFEVKTDDADKGKISEKNYFRIGVGTEFYLSNNLFLNFNLDAMSSKRKGVGGSLGLRYVF